jgi:hypothetical protein
LQNAQLARRRPDRRGRSHRSVRYSGYDRHGRGFAPGGCQWNRVDSSQRNYQLSPDSLIDLAPRYKRGAFLLSDKFPSNITMNICLSHSALLISSHGIARRYAIVNFSFQNAPRLCESGYNPALLAFRFSCDGSFPAQNSMKLRA